MSRSSLAALKTKPMVQRSRRGAERPAGVKPSREKWIKSVYHRIQNGAKGATQALTAAFERTLRFFALPVALACLVEWKECKRNVFLVLWDHLYIFFVLKYFPDNYSSCRLWEVHRKEWKYYFGSGYDPRSLRRRKRHVLAADCEVLFENKEACYHLCRSFDLPLPVQYGAISPGDDFAGTMHELFEQRGAERLVVKLVDGAGGKGTCLVEKANGDLTLRQSSDPARNIPLEGFSVRKRAVVQEWVRQHPVVSGVAKQALNTTRIVTLYTPEKEIIVVGAYIRIGTGSTFLDSGSGVGVRVDVETGRLDDRALNGRGQKVDFKPAAFDKLSDVTLPDWDKAVDLARRVQECFAPFNRFIGMDVGFSESGPVLIEINDVFDCSRFEGVNGPILKSEAVLDCCLKYELLTHNRFG